MEQDRLISPPAAVVKPRVPDYVTNPSALSIVYRGSLSANGVNYNVSGTREFDTWRVILGISFLECLKIAIVTPTYLDEPADFLSAKHIMGSALDLIKDRTHVYACCTLLYVDYKTIAVV